MTTQMKRKPHTAAYKFKVALAALRGEKTTAELCQEFGIVSSQLHKWKKEVVENGARIFEHDTNSEENLHAEINKLHSTIGKLKVENDFLEQVLGRCR